ncbi:Hypothetical predicted protein [Cloeon dipterum]|uniref:GH18 domain-containing protein n=1 Tax=Cloeon dipterum TaxID=197152 RepID=A0A8S1CS68_9INSE|nr:Hypothetical predicted protein [Cloeon dipterum]
MLFTCMPVCVGQCRLKAAVGQVKNNLKNDVRFCISQCLQLTVVGKEECTFNATTGKINGCDPRAQFRPSRFKVLCEFNYNWHIPTFLTKSRQSLCDIYIVPMATFNKSTNLIEMRPESLQAVPLFLREAKRYGIKVTLAIGSSDDYIMQPKDFTRIAMNNELTTKFAQGLAKLVNNFNIDGITISWMWPGCPEGNCIKDVGKRHVSAFVRAVATPLKEASKTVIYHMNGVNVNIIMATGDYFSDILDVVDYFLLQAQTQNNYLLGITKFNFNLNETKELIGDLQRKIKKSDEFLRKIILNTDPYYYSYELTNPKEGKIGTEYVKTSKEIKERIGMSEWCKLIKDPTYKLVKNIDTQNYAVRQKHLFIFDDYQSLRAKIEFVMGFGSGVGLYNTLADDFDGFCGCGNMPYLSLMASLLKMDCNPLPCF